MRDVRNQPGYRPMLPSRGHERQHPYGHGLRSRDKRYAGIAGPTCDGRRREASPPTSPRCSHPHRNSLTSPGNSGFKALPSTNTISLHHHSQLNPTQSDLGHVSLTDLQILLQRNAALQNALLLNATYGKNSVQSGDGFSSLFGWGSPQTFHGAKNTQISTSTSSWQPLADRMKVGTKPIDLTQSQTTPLGPATTPSQSLSPLQFPTDITVPITTTDEHHSTLTPTPTTDAPPGHGGVGSGNPAAVFVGSAVNPGAVCQNAAGAGGLGLLGGAGGVAALADALTKLQQGLDQLAADTAVPPSTEKTSTSDQPVTATMAARDSSHSPAAQPCPHPGTDAHDPATKLNVNNTGAAVVSSKSTFVAPSVVMNRRDANNVDVSVCSTTAGSYSAVGLGTQAEATGLGQHLPLTIDPVLVPGSCIVSSEEYDPDAPACR
jgi:hypothetical protein